MKEFLVLADTSCFVGLAMISTGVMQYFRVEGFIRQAGA